jgi:hypothetical protein
VHRPHTNAAANVLGGPSLTDTVEKASDEIVVAPRFGF